MIIGVTGTSNKNNHCDIVAAEIATMSALVYGKSTLVLQFYYEEEGIEHILNRGAATRGIGENRNIDELIKEATASTLSQNHFSADTISMLKTQNMLDVSGVSRVKQLMNQLIKKEDNIKYLIKKAKKTQTSGYDNVIIVAKNHNAEARKILMHMCDKIVVSLEQGDTYNEDDFMIGYKEHPEDKTLKMLPADKQIPVYPVVNDMDENSVFNPKYYKNKYKKKYVSYIPHCIAMMDHAAIGDAIAFLAGCSKLPAWDPNFKFAKAIEGLTGALIEKENEGVDFYDELPKNFIQHYDDDEPEPGLMNYDVEEKEKTVKKKKLFGYSTITEKETFAKREAPKPEAPKKEKKFGLKAKRTVKITEKPEEKSLEENITENDAAE